MSLTPRLTPSGQSGIRSRRILCAADVAERVSTNLSHHHQAYQPNQSLYDGSRQVFDDEEDVDGFAFNSRARSPDRFQEIVTMIQGQQELLREVLQEQKRMQSKQELLESRLEEISRAVESSCSSSSPEDRRKKFRIKRDLTVSYHYT